MLERYEQLLEERRQLQFWWNKAQENGHVGLEKLYDTHAFTRNPQHAVVHASAEFNRLLREKVRGTLMDLAAQAFRERMEALNGEILATKDQILKKLEET